MRSSSQFSPDRAVAAVIICTVIAMLSLYLCDNWQFPFP